MVSAACQASFLVALGAGCSAPEPRAPTPVKVVPEARAEVHERHATPASQPTPRISFGFGGVERDLNGVDLQYDIFVGAPVAMAQRVDEIAAGTVVRYVACAWIVTYEH